MGSKRFDYLRDMVRHHSVLHVKCVNCGHKGELDPLTLTGRFNMDMSSPIQRAVDRMICSACDGRQMDWWCWPKNRD